MNNVINIKPEPCFDRIKKTLTLGGKPDRLPLCDFSIADTIKEWVIGRKAQRLSFRSAGEKVTPLVPQDEVEFWIKGGYDYVCTWPFYGFFALSDVKAKEGSISAEGTGVIHTLDDLTDNKWPWHDLEKVSYENVTGIAKVMPDDMKIVILAHDIFTYVWENMGFTHFCNCLYEDTELISEMFRQIGEAVYKINKRTVELIGDKLGAIWYADYLAFNTGTFVNPDVYRKYLFPWVEKISNLTRDLDIPFIYHSDGKLWSLFDDFYDMGVNAIHPLEPKSMDAVKVKKKQGDRFCLIGNIDVDLLSRGTQTEVETMVKDRIKKLGYNGGYCVGSSNTLPDYVSKENFKAMVETVFKYG